MIVSDASSSRSLKTEMLQADLVVTGGGFAGVCASITAARQGLKVVLIGDRPVLGGNSSSEVRLWVLGATSHMTNNNRWAREGGVIDEILLENIYRNPDGNPIIYDTVLLEKVISEPNITLLLNTAVFEVLKTDPNRIDGVRAFCSQNSTIYEAHAPLFLDASGDGIVGFLAGAAFRIGAETASEFDEKYAPDESYGHLLGHTIYFYSKDVGRPVTFVPPSFALEDITKVPRFKSFNAHTYGCRLWWIEYGGRLDTVHDTEKIKWELWKVVYGVWNYIKNSGNFPEAANLTLEWVGHVPGKRESRRFEGDYMLNQRDIVEQHEFADGVAFGGWSIDLHPADGVYSPRPGCNQSHSKGIYQIPYRCLYSKNIENLFLAGRIISASHVAFGSSRVMATCAHSAQAAGVAASICLEKKATPREVGQNHLSTLLCKLLRTGQHVPLRRLEDPDDLVRQAQIGASSTYRLQKLAGNGNWFPLKRALAQMLPAAPGAAPEMIVSLRAEKETEVRLELRVCSRKESHTPDVSLGCLSVSLRPGEPVRVPMRFSAAVDRSRYLFYIVHENPLVSIELSDERVTGILRLHHTYKQTAKTDQGVDEFEFWVPERRPGGQNFAFELDAPVDCFAARNLANGVQRPTDETNAWLAALEDPKPTISLEWTEPQAIGRVELFFDNDYDHAVESVLMGHPENAMPFCVKHYRILDGETGAVLHECADNHQARNIVRLAEPVKTGSLRIELLESHGAVPKGCFEVRAYR